MTKNDFGYKIKKAMQEGDIPAKEVAKKLKLTRQQINNWIRNKSKPTIDNFIEFLKMTNRDPNYFFGYPSANISGGTNNNIFGSNNIINQLAHNSEDIEFLKKEVGDLKYKINSPKKRKQ
jgi:transcriptional regulator with XRE-family HTH domain